MAELSDKEILASGPALFLGTEEEIKAKFKTLAFKWHPDRGGDREVLEHLIKLRDKALNRDKLPTIMFGKVRMKYMSHPAPDIWVGGSSVVYKAEKTDPAWRFANDKMKENIKPFLPLFVHDFDGHLAYRRKSSEILLSDLMRVMGPLPCDHVSWIVSRLLNLACYLQWSGRVHCQIDADHLLIDPEKHWVSLTGPTTFLTPMGTRPKTVPGRTLGANQWLSNKAAVASPKIDLALIRLTALELLGDRSGCRLKNIRPSILAWLTSAAPDNAFKDFDAWTKALGERKFVKFDVTAQEIYSKGL